MGNVWFFHRFAGCVLAHIIIIILYASQRVAAWHKISPMYFLKKKKKEHRPSPRAYTAAAAV